MVLPWIRKSSCISGRGGAAAVAGGKATIFPADLRRLSIEERLAFMFAGRGAIYSLNISKL